MIQIKGAGGTATVAVTSNMVPIQNNIIVTVPINQIRLNISMTERNDKYRVVPFRLFEGALVLAHLEVQVANEGAARHLVDRGGDGVRAERSHEPACS